tara:strand:- start:117 stop:344 length:228 start_codon:yes stop_codon:yes gene_type:complete
MRNGSLYYNEVTNRVERVVGKLNGKRVFTVSHGYSEFGPARQKDLRKASGEEVDLYLEESGILKNNSRELQVSLA